ncbi:hypothetical protein HG531_003145 [Fusarium graminearum]|nr:hypothetical protein HG531_003145 [Fusarium graminearum]
MWTATLLPRLGDVKEFGQSFNNSLNVHVDQRHAVVRVLLHDSNESQVTIYLAQHDGLVAVVKDKTALCSVAANLFVYGCTPRLPLKAAAPLVTALPRPVDFSDVYDNIDVVATNLVASHVGGGTVGRDVDLC